MRGRFLSLRVKVVVMILLMAACLAASMLGVSYYIYSEAMMAHYARMTANLAKTTAKILDEKDIRELSQEVLARYRAVCDGKMPPDLETVSGQEREAYFARFADIAETAAYRRINEDMGKIRKANQVLSLYLVYMDIQTGKCVYVCDSSPADEICMPGL